MENPTTLSLVLAFLSGILFLTVTFVAIESRRAKKYGKQTDWKELAAGLLMLGVFTAGQILAETVYLSGTMKVVLMGGAYRVIRLEEPTLIPGIPLGCWGAMVAGMLFFTLVFVGKEWRRDILKFYPGVKSFLHRLHRLPSALAA